MKVFRKEIITVKLFTKKKKKKTLIVSYQTQSETIKPKRKTHKKPVHELQVSH